MFEEYCPGIFLGTGASEMIPNPFCNCDVCNYARKHSEEQRVRSAFLLDNHTCIDFGPDVMSSSMRFTADLSQINDILITHTHDDHFSIANFEVISCNIPKPKNKFTIHLSEIGYNWLLKQRQIILEASGGMHDIISGVANGYYSVISHKAFEKFTIGEKEIFPVYGFHGGDAPDEKSLNYRITENGRTLLYAIDTGIYPEETIEALSDFPVDVLIMDATFGSKKMDKDCTHLDAYSFISQLEALIKAGIVTADTKVYASHINHYNLWKHNEFQDFFDKNAPVHVSVARDGMKICF